MLRTLVAIFRSSEAPAPSARESATVAGVQVGKTPSEARGALEAAGHPGTPITNPSVTETGTVHTVAAMKMDVRVMDGATKPPRIVTTVQGTKQPVNPANGRNFGNIPKAEQRDRSHILLEKDPIK